MVGNIVPAECYVGEQLNYEEVIWALKPKVHKVSLTSASPDDI